VKLLNQNLNTLKFNNGDTINLAKNPEEWLEFGDNGIPACCFYEYTEDTSAEVFYNYFCIEDDRGIIPEDCHLPNEHEWEEFLLSEGINKTEHARQFKGDMSNHKSTEGWEEDYQGGTNSSGLNFKPLGVISLQGKFAYQGTGVYLWGANNFNDIQAYYLEISRPWFDKPGELDLINYNLGWEKKCGMNIRLAKNV